MSERQNEIYDGNAGSPPAKRRGYYWDALSPKLQKAYEGAEVHGLDNEIALLRMMITRTLSNSPCDFGLLARELKTLARLERSNACLRGQRRKEKSVLQRR